MNDIDYMKIACDLAIKGRGQTSPNPMVGAVVVKDGKIVGEGWHKRCGGPHAELWALNQAGVLAKGAKLYVTLEPCHHYGRTPPCVDKILEKGVEEVIVGIKDPNPLTNGKSIRRLQKAGIKVKAGILKEEISSLNEAFIKYMRHQLPFVVAKIAQTLDGKTAAASGQSQWITSVTTRGYARRLRNDFDAILTGINTVIKDNPGLNAAKKSKPIKKVILDSRLRIPLKAKLFEDTHPQDCFIATTAKAAPQKLKDLRAKGVQVIMCPIKNQRVHLKWLFQELARREISYLLIEGGSQVIGSALKEKLVDKLHIYIAPKIMGDYNALNAVNGLTTTHVNRVIRIKNMIWKNLGTDVLIEGNVDYYRV